MKLIPGTPFNAGKNYHMPNYNIMKDKYGFDQPVAVQYAHYMVDLVKGDLGISFQFNNTPVTQLLLNEFSHQLILGFQAMFFGAVLGIILRCC